MYGVRLDSVVQNKQLCSEPTGVTAQFHYQTDTSSDAEFFVAIGVVCMLFSVAALAGYTVYGERYSESSALPIAVRRFIDGVCVCLCGGGLSPGCDGPWLA